MATLTPAFWSHLARWFVHSHAAITVEVAIPVKILTVDEGQESQIFRRFVADQLGDFFVNSLAVKHSWKFPRVVKNDGCLS